MARRRAAREQSKLFGNRLYNGENLAILRGGEIGPETVDLVYLDPPFNSNQDFNVIFKELTGLRPTVQTEAFKDTWEWNQNAMNAFHDTVESAPPGVVRRMLGFRSMIGESDVLAYLSMMAPRLVELHRVLKPTGTLYLHCDDTSSHYLKLLLDAIFDPRNFRNEVIWKRTNARSTKKRWPRVHDVLLVYAKSPAVKFNYLLVKADKAKMPHTLITGPDGKKYQTYELTAAGVREGHSGEPWRGFDPGTMGRHWGQSHAVMDALDEKGLIHWPKSGKAGGFPRRRDEKPFKEELRTVTVGDVWTDIDRINQSAKEKLPWPTQKPEKLLERIIEASTSRGDVVLDAFCGCGTAVAVAQEMGRQWIGIDHSMFATDVIQQRLIDRYGEDIKKSYEFIPKPVTAQDARKLKDTPFLFEWWAIERAGAQPSAKRKGADKGIDGRIYFREYSGAGKIEAKQVVISVKSGKTGPAHVRELRGVIEREDAAIGVLITMNKPTKAMVSEAASAGRYFSETWDVSYPRLQIVTVEDLMTDKPIDYPGRLPASAEKEAAQVREAQSRTMDAVPAQDWSVPRKRT
jgi:DNA modification methylase